MHSGTFPSPGPAFLEPPTFHHFNMILVYIGASSSRVSPHWCSQLPKNQVLPLVSIALTVLPLCHVSPCSAKGQHENAQPRITDRFLQRNVKMRLVPLSESTWPVLSRPKLN